MTSGSSERNERVIDTSRLETEYADAFEVVISPGEITLAFGRSRAPDTLSAAGLTANLTNRIFLSPYLAKRLARQLGSDLHRYESLFGVLTREVPPAVRPALRSMRDEPCRYHSEDIAAKARALMGLIDELGVDYAMERSFKMSDRSLSANRFIVGFKRSELRRAPDAALAAVLGAMGMPPRSQEEFLVCLPTAEFIHFGFEERGDGCLFKAYLEFKGSLKCSLDGTRVAQDPFLLYLGFKWNPFDSDRCFVSRYTCYPLLSLGEILSRLAALYGDGSDFISLTTTRKILIDKVRILSDNKIMYEEVREEGNPRNSFDINLYGASLRIRDIYPYLLGTGRRYALPDRDFIELCDRIGERAVGHLSGGVDRNGGDFLTVYYGVEGINRNV